MKKLSLNKETIANLNSDAMDRLKGGADNQICQGTTTCTNFTYCQQLTCGNDNTCNPGAACNPTGVAC